MSEKERHLVKQILRSRARMLARPHGLESGREIVYDLVEFVVSGRRFAFEAKFVDEAFSIKDVSPVPQTSSLVVGITNVRSQMVTVIELSVLLGLEPSQSSGDGLILRFGALRLAVQVDKVIAVRQVDNSELAHGFTGLSDRLAAFSLSLTSDMLIILDAKRIFTDSMIVQLAG